MMRRPTCTAALAVVLLLVGNLLAWVHESEVQHVTCTEHGEELHAAEPSGETATPEDSRWIAVDGAGGEHQDCATARLLRASTRPTSSSCTSTVVISIATVDVPVLVPALRAVDVIAHAPKTSPPA